MFGIGRWLRNRVEDFLHPRPGFTVEINGRQHEGRALTIGMQRDLTRSGAYAAIDALKDAAAGKRQLSGVELADHLDAMTAIAAAGLRRPVEWVSRHLTSTEVGQAVVATWTASNPKPKEDEKRPPAESPS